VVRDSTNVLASENPKVALAIRYMWELQDLDVSVDDVAHAISLPRRSLERLFREEMDCGINAVLQRRRLERCCELLIRTELPIAEIVPMIGLRSKEYLHKLFRQTYKITPHSYRLENRG
jgi:LacI family transcriptional regulator